MDVISWDRAPEAVKLEFETCKALIHELTDTPDLSFDNVKGIGNISGTALELMFLGPMLKANWSKGDYQVVISRAINVIKAGMKTVSASSKDLTDVRIESEFTSVLPKNKLEAIQMLSEALGGKASISQKTALQHNPMVANATEEEEHLKKESANESANQLGETHNV